MFFDEYSEREVLSTLEDGNVIDADARTGIICEWMEKEASIKDAFDYLIDQICDVDKEELVSSFCHAIKNGKKDEFGEWLATAIRTQLDEIITEKYNEARERGDGRLCGLCHGTGGGPSPLQCPACRGSGDA